MNNINVGLALWPYSLATANDPLSVIARPLFGKGTKNQFEQITEFSY